MQKTAAELRQFQYDRKRVSAMLTGDELMARGALRGWFRQKLISGAHQREKNAAIKFNAVGVVEAWNLWADHAGLDRVSDMPADVKELKEALGSAGNGVELQISTDEHTVTVILPPGVNLKVVHAA